MATLKAADPWATEPARKPAPKPAGKNGKAKREPAPPAVAVVGPGYNLRLVLDPVTLGRLRAVAEAEDRSLRVMALRLLRAQLDAIETKPRG